MQVYLPDDLYKSVKAQRLPVSELLQEAVRAELRRLHLISESDEYVAALVHQVGQPTAQQRARARASKQWASALFQVEMMTNEEEVRGSDRWTLRTVRSPHQVLGSERLIKLIGEARY